MDGGEFFGLFIFREAVETDDVLFHLQVKAGDEIQSFFSGSSTMKLGLGWLNFFPKLNLFREDSKFIKNNQLIIEIEVCSLQISLKRKIIIFVHLF
jgi:hypothetical protein